MRGYVASSRTGRKRLPDRGLFFQSVDASRFEYFGVVESVTDFRSARFKQIFRQRGQSLFRVLQRHRMHGDPVTGGNEGTADIVATGVLFFIPGEQFAELGAPGLDRFGLRPAESIGRLRQGQRDDAAIEIGITGCLQLR